MLTTESKKTLLGGLHYTTNHSGKMQGIHSLSTSVAVNPHCIERQKNGNSICSKCFSATMMKRYSALNAVLISNTEILTSGVLDWDLLPLTPTRYFRFEAFGDLINEYQVVNYFNIARKNPETLFALWTKNPRIIERALENSDLEKPSNLQIVLSSPLINVALKTTKFDFVDKIFSVYDKETAKGVNINCGSRSCLGCGRCYRPNPNGERLQFINEILK